MRKNNKKKVLFLFTLICINLMAQQNFKIIETNYNLNDFESIRQDLMNYEFYQQNLDTY